MSQARCFSGFKRVGWPSPLYWFYCCMTVEKATLQISHITWAWDLRCLIANLLNVTVCGKAQDVKVSPVSLWLALNVPVKRKAKRKILIILTLEKWAVSLFLERLYSIYWLIKMKFIWICIFLVISESKLFPVFIVYLYFFSFVFFSCELPIHALFLDPSVFLVLCLISLLGNY